jgi:hypothetical protein
MPPAYSCAHPATKCLDVLPLLHRRLVSIQPGRCLLSLRLHRLQLPTPEPTPLPITAYPTSFPTAPTYAPTCNPAHHLIFQWVYGPWMECTHPEEQTRYLFCETICGGPAKYNDCLGTWNGWSGADARQTRTERACPTTATTSAPTTPPTSAQDLSDIQPSLWHCFWSADWHYFWSADWFCSGYLSMLLPIQG